MLNDRKPIYIRHAALLCAFVFVCLSVPIQNKAWADCRAQYKNGPIAPNGTNCEPPAGAKCDFAAFKAAVAQAESGELNKAGPGKSSPEQYRCVNSYGYSGKYQIGGETLKDCGYMRNSVRPDSSSAQWTGKDGISTYEDFLSNLNCVQEKAYNCYLDSCKNYIEKLGLAKYVGTQFNKDGYACTVNWSGLLGACQFGIGNLQKTLTGTPVKDGNGVSQAKYLCQFAKYQTPYDKGVDHAGAAACDPNVQPANKTDVNNVVTLPISGETINVTDPTHKMDLLAEGLKGIWVASLQLMTSQLQTAMMQQVQAIATIFDAKHQLEVQRLVQQRVAQAHKDYSPSEQMCEIGTMIRHLADTEKNADLTQVTMAQHILQREMVSGDAMTAEGMKSDSASRLKQYRDKYCNTKDDGNNVDYLCNKKDAAPDRKNRDIDYAATLDNPLTLKLDIKDNELSPDEENLFALLNNLFHHKPFHAIPPAYTSLSRLTAPYGDMRSIIAMRGIARNSFSAIIAQKTEGPEHEGNARPYIYSLLQEFGLDETEIKKMFGENPSYYAQMEILTKKIFQHPNFIMNLYDKPANITRTRTAMQAIKTMQDRDIHEAMLRREMLMSMILEVRLRQHQRDVTSAIRATLKDSTPIPGSAPGGN